MTESIIAQDPGQLINEIPSLMGYNPRPEGHNVVLFFAPSDPPQLMMSAVVQPDAGSDIEVHADAIIHRMALSSSAAAIVFGFGGHTEQFEAMSKAVERIHAAIGVTSPHQWMYRMDGFPSERWMCSCGESHTVDRTTLSQLEQRGQIPAACRDDLIAGVSPLPFSLEAYEFGMDLFDVDVRDWNYLLIARDAKGWLDNHLQQARSVPTDRPIMAGLLSCAVLALYLADRHPEARELQSRMQYAIPAVMEVVAHELRPDLVSATLLQTLPNWLWTDMKKRRQP